MNSCQDLVYVKHITGRYYLVAVDTDDQMDLGFQTESKDYIGLLGQTVFAVGFNKNYIIAKQHHYNNRNITNYYIIFIYHEMTYWPEKGVIAPFTKEEFNKKRHELNISDIKFTKVIKSLE